MTHRAQDADSRRGPQLRMASPPCRAAAWTLVLGAALGCTGLRPPAPSPEAAPAPPSAAVRPGLEVLLSDSIHLVQGQRVGLITNPTAVARDGRHAIELLRAAPGVTLAALFAPEHGLRGDADPGERIESGVDQGTGIPVHSLYGDTRAPTRAMLAGLDVLVFDIQTLDARPYTYAWTMALAMEAAARRGLPFVVLDRPVPTGGRHVQGNVLDPAFASFVGLLPVAMRYGMTIGELALLLNETAAANNRARAELHVVPLDGWRRSMAFDETGLPWVAPSPNLPSLESAFHYPGTVLFEGTNLSVGRGTDRAFQQVGAPWLDGDALAARLSARRLPGVRVEPVTFVPADPADGKFAGEEVHGVRFTVTDRSTYDPTLTAAAALLHARLLSGDRWRWNEVHFDRLAGTDGLRRQIEAGVSLDEIAGLWAAEREPFTRLRASHLLY